MKNQYLGDVGDYGKYGMLRFFARNNIRIAVNWYLTPDDGSTDGKHITYLNNNAMRRYDENLFDLLAAMVRAGDRNVITFEEQDAISGATYYHQLLHDEGNSRSDKSAYRDGWHKAALEASKDAELVFLDPDNGACEKEPVNAKNSIKYCYADEVADYYERGQNVVYYCSKGRRNYEQWEDTKALMKRRLQDARIAIITFHKGTQRSYVFVLHKESFRIYAELINKFLRTWSKVFSEESVGTGRLDGGKTGELFCVTDSNGVELTIEECEDGWVNIRFSDRKNSYSRISIDHLFNKLR